MSDLLKAFPHILIVGPQGSGKSLLARAIATAGGGTFAEVTGEDLLDKFGLQCLAGRKQPTLIIEELSADLLRYGNMVARLKSLMTDKRVMINRKAKPAVLVNPPRMIFCTGTQNPMVLHENERRFHVIHTGVKGQALPRPSVDSGLRAADESTAPRPIRETFKVSTRTPDGAMCVTKLTRVYTRDGR